MAAVVFSNPAQVAAYLWTNGRDSLVHALDHFRERDSDTPEAHGHHDKWIALSVHHAAECISNMRLVTLAPTHSAFRLRKDGTVHFPHLGDTLAALQGSGIAPSPSPAELKLFQMLSGLVPVRHSFMHRMIPPSWDVSEAAMCMIGLLKYAERLRGSAGSDLVWQSMPVERDVMAAVHYKRIEAYLSFAGHFVAEKYRGMHLYGCPGCGLETVANGVCEACYEDLGHVTDRKSVV